MNKACPLGREAIARRCYATGADMPALAQALRGHAPPGPRLGYLGWGYLGWGYLGPPGVDRGARPASTRSQAGHPVDKQPRCAPLDRAPSGLVPGPIGAVLQVEGVAQRQHPMGQHPMGPRAMA